MILINFLAFIYYIKNERTAHNGFINFIPSCSLVSENALYNSPEDMP